MRSALPVALFALAAAAAAAADLEVLSMRQVAPGNVVVAISAPGAPEPAEFSLHLDDAEPVAASRLTPLPTPPVPLWLVLCLDRSGSIGPRTLESLKTGLHQALVAGRDGELPYKVAITSFATRPVHLLEAFSSDPARIAAAIDLLAVDRAPAGRSRMYDAIAGGIAALRAQGEGSKRLIVVSDGKDEGSTVSAAQLARLTQGRERIVIDALALGALARDHSGELAAMAGASGGRFLPRAEPDVAPSLRRLIAEAAPPLRYELAFRYDAAAGAGTARSSAIGYAPADGAAVRAALPLALAAPAAPDAASAPAAVPGETRITLELVLDWLRNAPTLLALLAALLLVAALVLAYRRRQRQAGTGQVVVESVSVSVRSAEVPAPPAARVRNPTAVGHAWPAPAPGRPVALLRGVAGSSRGEMVAVTKAQFRIGCDPDNDLVLVGDDFASGRHALLRWEAGGLYAEDLGSTNGSHLNGGRFGSETRALAPGDELRFGRTTFQVMAAQPTAGPAAGPSGFEPSPG